MTSHLDSHTTTDVQTGNGIPYDIYNIRSIAHVRTNRNAKTTRANLYTYIGVGQGTCKKSRPFPARAYTTLVVLVDLMLSLKGDKMAA